MSEVAPYTVQDGKVVRGESLLLVGVAAACRQGKGDGPRWPSPCCLAYLRGYLRFAE